MLSANICKMAIKANNFSPKSSETTGRICDAPEKLLRSLSSIRRCRKARPGKKRKTNLLGPRVILAIIESVRQIKIYGKIYREDKCERIYLYIYIYGVEYVCLGQQIAVARHVRGQQITSNYRNLRRNSLSQCQFSEDLGPRTKDQQLPLTQDTNVKLETRAGVFV